MSEQIVNSEAMKIMVTRTTCDVNKKDWLLFYTASCYVYNQVLDLKVGPEQVQNYNQIL